MSWQVEQRPVADAAGATTGANTIAGHEARNARGAPLVRAEGHRTRLVAQRARPSDRRRGNEATAAALTNFRARLPEPHSDLARESLKDPYRLDVRGLGEDAQERVVEAALVQHITKFLLELGAGVAFVGRQRVLDVSGDEFFIDLLFYHLRLRREVVVELKAGRFKPEHLGQLGFYCTAIDAQVNSPDDEATIGLLLCKTKNEVVAEYALRTTTVPLGIADYQLVDSLPKELDANLPSIKRIEEELAKESKPTPSAKRKSRGHSRTTGGRR